MTIRQVHGAGTIGDSRRPWGRPAHLSTGSEPDFVVAPLDVRSIFPQELPLLVPLGGLRLVERFGDWSGGPFAGDSPIQLCVCEAA